MGSVSTKDLQKILDNFNAGNVDDCDALAAVADLVKAADDTPEAHGFEHDIRYDPEERSWTKKLDDKYIGVLEDVSEGEFEDPMWRAYLVRRRGHGIVRGSAGECVIEDYVRDAVEVIEKWHRAELP